ncbi:MAG: sulfatase-like hydrolase/transferase [Anaerolineae bacterium]
MTTQPNILMIVTDQEYAHQSLPAGCVLPNRDRIRSRGVTFDNHHATTTVCTPSRSVMITGRHTPHTGMFDNTNFAWIDDMKADPEALPTIGHLLRDQGYYTVLKGKWHLSEFPGGRHPGRDGTLRFLGLPGMGRCLRRADGWVSQRSKDCG